MPLDPTLGELSGQQPSPADAASMTHQPEQPNPAAPYLQGARDIARKTFVDPLKSAGFLPQDQAPSWYPPVREAAGELFRQGPASMIAGQLPHGGLAQLASDAGYLPPWVSNNPFANMLRSPEFQNATQFFTPLVGTLGLTRVPNRTDRWGKDQFEITHKETGEKRGDVWLTYDPETRNLKVGYLSARGSRFSNPNPNNPLSDPRQWALGKNPLDAAVELRSALPEAFNFYPDMKTIEFEGVGGAKKKQNVSANLKFEVTKTPDGQVEWKKIRHETFARNALRSSQYPASASPPSDPSPPPAPAPAPWDTMRQQQNESWEDMRRRQDMEWDELMRRLRGNL